MRHFHTIVCLTLALAACSEAADAPSAPASKPTQDFGFQGGNLESALEDQDANSCENVPAEYIGVGDGCDCPAGGSRGCDSDCDSGKEGAQFCGCDYCYFPPESADDEGESTQADEETATGIDGQGTSSDDSSNDQGTTSDDALDTTSDDALDTTSDDALDTTSDDALDTTSDDALDTTSDDALDTTSDDALDTTSDDALDTTSDDALDTTSDDALDTTSDDEGTDDGSVETSTEPDVPPAMTTSSSSDDGEGEPPILIACTDIPDEKRGAGDGCDCSALGDLGCDPDCFSGNDATGECGCDTCHSSEADAPEEQAEPEDPEEPEIFLGCSEIPSENIGADDGCDCSALGDLGCDPDCNNGNRGDQDCGCEFCH